MDNLWYPVNIPALAYLTADRFTTPPVLNVDLYYKKSYNLFTSFLIKQLTNGDMIISSYTILIVHTEICIIILKFKFFYATPNKYDLEN